jgi:hypothetical protein
MSKVIFILLAMVGLEGCVSAEYGNFTAQTLHTPQVLNATLLTDTVKQLEALYPPASTQLNIGQAIENKDPFGAGLVTTLRNHGYAVQDYSEQPLSTKGIRLQYLLDVPATAEQALYRVKIRVGGNDLTRAYVVQNDTVIPAGSWTRREDH